MINIQVKSQPFVNIQTFKEQNVLVEQQDSTVVIEHGTSSDTELFAGEGINLEPVTNGMRISVNTSKKAEQDNTLPITSAAVYTEIGNIDALLQLI